MSATLIAGAGVLPVFAQTTANVDFNASASAAGAVTNGGPRPTGTLPLLDTSANVSANANASATVSTKISLIERAQEKADQEIARRIDALNALSARVNGMVKVSSDDKANLNSEIQSQITAMNTLQAQVTADAAANSTTSLKADVQSITKAYRIFALVIPEGAIEAAADRVETIVGLMTQLAGTLQTRITAAQSAGADMTASVSALADMNAKVADANTQAQAAVTEIADLQPDNGVQSVKDSNTAALKDARTKIQAAQQDLVTARKDAGNIVKALESLSISASASSTTSASGSVNR